MMSAIRSWGSDTQAWDRAYVAGMSVPDVTIYLDEYAQRSAQARATLNWREYFYGPQPAERLHLFPASGTNTPLLIFVHGGYWRELTEAESSFAAPGVVAAGSAFAALGYGLAPKYTLSTIVTMVSRAIRWLHAHGYRPDHTVLTGHSAGAHLALMCLLADPTLARAAVLLSGLYELSPLCHTSIGKAIGLTEKEAATNSPTRRLHAGLPTLVVARAAEDPVGFSDQQTHLIQASSKLGVSIANFVVPERNHFDLPFGIDNRDDPVGSQVAAQLLLT